MTVMRTNQIVTEITGFALLNVEERIGALECIDSAKFDRDTGKLMISYDGKDIVVSINVSCQRTAHQ